MNNELKLKLQAHLDGELPEGEARRVAELIASDAEARALVAELGMTRSFLAGNEPDVKLPESREFYWGRIERAILKAEAAETSVLATSGFNWRRLFAPLAGVATAVVIGLVTLHYTDYAPFDNSLRDLAEVENESEHMGSYSFRSHSGNMFAVWVYEKASQVEPEPVVQPIEDDLFFLQ
jgi:anti-sigma factor RsiW